MTVSKVKRIECSGETLTYDITCDGNNLFYANGVLTHNSGYSEGSPDMTSTSESFGLPATLDWFIAITMDEVLSDNGQQLIHLLKTRWGNKSKVKPQLVNINFDKMRYSDVGMPTRNDSVKETQAMAGKGKRPKQKVSEIDWN